VTISKKTAVGIALAAIAAHWIYQIASNPGGAPIPEHFSELVLRIVRNKLIVVRGHLPPLAPGRGGLPLARGQPPRLAEACRASDWSSVSHVRPAQRRLELGHERAHPRPENGGPSILSFFKDRGNLLLGFRSASSAAASSRSSSASSS
jgi:hypothetical protein